MNFAPKVPEVHARVVSSGQLPVVYTLEGEISSPKLPEYPRREYELQVAKDAEFKGQVKAFDLGTNGKFIIDIKSELVNDPNFGLKPGDRIFARGHACNILGTSEWSGPVEAGIYNPRELESGED
ncbi:hypothetical protein ACIQU6_07580 [Streptomyces sp. NPDC090442]|uniref:hypothetical protein n=1 Tax=Streptomyces sp. NPDC090442 TaxID=3365962 RepID=UPI003824CB5D